MFEISKTLHTLRENLHSRGSRRVGSGVYVIAIFSKQC